MFDGGKNGEIPNIVESGVREAEGGREREGARVGREKEERRGRG